MQQLIEPGIHNLGDFIEKALTKYGEKPAFSCLGQTVSFSDIEELLVARGITVSY